MDIKRIGGSSGANSLDILDKSLQLVASRATAVLTRALASVELLTISERTASRFATHDHFSGRGQARRLLVLEAWSAAPQSGVRSSTTSEMKGAMINSYYRWSCSRTWTSEPLPDSVTVAGRGSLNASCRADVKNWLRYSRGERSASAARFLELGLTVIATHGRSAIDVELGPT